MKQIKDHSDLELKAAGYDSIATIEMHQQNIKLINEELARRANEKQPSPETKTE